jgi:2-dehydro-3-deoxyphosphogluconate aldolase/(4S)-4-hydroxy-2-oxoglutarate aldolase
MANAAQPGDRGMRTIESLMRTGPVIPVLVIEDARNAGPIARALVSGGLRVLEVTLRTPVALDAIRAMAEVPGAIVGAGTVLNQRDVERSMEAGAEFLVSPGLTEPVARAAREAGVPLLPGVANASDIMRGYDLGLTHFKFFPAAASGGVPALRSLAGPFGEASFCPTGGVTQESAAEWLAIEQVLCVGGTWLVPRGAPDLEAVTLAARRAAGLGAQVNTNRAPAQTR